MMNIFFVFIFVFCFLLQSEAPIKAIGLEVYNYEDAMIFAKENGMKVYVVFTGENCEWCEKQKEILNDPEVIEKVRNYIFCYVDCESRKELKRRYKTRIIPSHLILDHDEKIIKKHSGYQDRDRILEWLDQS